ncbi:MAG: hypothetical protein ACOYM9_18460 [Bradymonadia bacterium]
MTWRPRGSTAALALWLASCGGGASAPSDPPRDATPAPSPDAAEAPTDLAVARDAASDAALADAATPPATTTVSFDFGSWGLLPFEEVPSICASWTLENDAPLYIERLRMLNGGAFHHANWYVVPDDRFDGPDGWFGCRQRDFREASAVLLGTPLFAQSTQTLYEEQHLGTGVAIKIPPRHRIIASVHMLNLSARSLRTSLRVSLDLLHPRDVRTVAAPFRLYYDDLHLGPQRRSDFTTECDLATPYAARQGRPLALSLLYLLPHYHGLGRRFEVELYGGPRDGEAIFDLEGFDGLAHGQSYAPPLDLAAAGALGLRLRCTYDNPSPREVGFGLADGEMCMLLGFADLDLLLDAGVQAGDTVVGTSDEVEHHEGPCDVLVLPRKPSQDAPSADELAAPLYLPPAVDPEGPPIEPVAPPSCAPPDLDVMPAQPVTLRAIRDEVFRPTCAFSACHGGPAPAAGLALDQDDLGELRRGLVRHEVQAETVLDLVDPGDGLASWLYQRISTCTPKDDRGRALAPMPLNAPELLPADQLARIRAWIDAGAEVE